jgi:Rap1a immunity proteins
MVLPVTTNEMNQSPEARWLVIDAAMARFRKAAKTAIAMVLFAATCVLLAPHPADAFESARALATQCESVDASNTQNGADALIPGTKAALQCWGYMQAMQDLSVLVDEKGRRLMGACPNEQTNLVQLTRAFVAYADRHSDESENDAALIVMDALRESFPCP